MAEFYESGRQASGIRSVLSVVIPAFDMASNEDIIRKNPFSFSLSAILPNDRKQRKALTPEQQENFLDFVRNDPIYSKYYDMINILLGTGIRVSEYCGLTVDDIDFVNRRFLVEKQIVYGSDCKLYVEKPKTAHSMRYIPITNQIEQSLKNLVEKSQKSNAINVVDGYHALLH